jgi:hypothetical protein
MKNKFHIQGYDYSLLVPCLPDRQASDPYKNFKYRPMKNTLIVSLVISLILISGMLHAQKLPVYYQSNNIKVYNQAGRELKNPFFGGLAFPVFTQLDVNYDGKEDLIILDRVDDRLLILINQTTDPNKPEYLFAPQYEKFFPDAIQRTIIMADYDRDGKKDIFAYSSYWGAGFEVYRNISTAHKIEFELISDQIECSFYGNPWKSNLYISRIDVPSILDIDNDGDLDVLTFNILGGFLELYINTSQDSFGHSDSLHFVYADASWGAIMESDSSNDLTLGIRLPPVLKTKNPYRPEKQEPPARHSGSTIMAHDMDGDGDIDLLLGDIEFEEIVYCENGKADYGTKLDTIIKTTMQYPASHPIRIRCMPAPFYLDVNNDGIKDLVLSPMDEDAFDTFENLDQVWYYRNDGQNNNPSFTFVQSDFLQCNMIDLGGPTSPAFFDYDNDGDMDLFVVTKGDLKVTHHKKDRIVLFENIGDSDTAVFKILDDDYLGLSKKGYRSLSLSFGDLNANGKTDLLMGEQSGRLIFYENTADTGNIADFQFVTDFYDSIDLGIYAYPAPAIVDLNKDGLSDLVIGVRSGSIKYYENTGNTSGQKYHLITDTLGGIILPQDYPQYPKPVFKDLDLNGNLDLVIGTFAGRLLFYHDIQDDIYGTYKKVDSLIYDSIFEQVVTRHIGRNVKVAFADLDADKFPDMIVGTERGGLMLYTTSRYCRDYQPLHLNGPEIICLGTERTLDAGAGYDSYLWNTGQTTRTIKTDTAGIYTCEVVKQNCTYYPSVELEKHMGVLEADFTYLPDKFTYTFSIKNKYITHAYWDFGDGAFSFDMNPIHSFDKDGNYKVCLNVMDACGVTDKVCKNIEVLTSIKDFFESNLVALYPNPGTDFVYFKAHQSISGQIAAFEINDVHGRQVLYQETNQSGIHKIDMSKYQSGVYLFKVYDDQNMPRGMKKLIKQ